MKGDCTFTVSGIASYVKNYPTAPGKPYGSFNIGLDIAGQLIGKKNFPGGRLFINVAYNDKDTPRPFFNVVASRLSSISKSSPVPMVLTGKLKVKPAKDQYPESLSFEADWDRIGFDFKGEALNRPINNVSFYGEFVGQDSDNSIQVKYSYRNIKDDSWKDRLFTFWSVEQLNFKPRDPCMVYGRVLINSTSNPSYPWVHAEHVL